MLNAWMGLSHCLPLACSRPQASKCPVGKNHLPRQLPSYVSNSLPQESESLPLLLKTLPALSGLHCTSPSSPKRNRGLMNPSTPPRQTSECSFPLPSKASPTLGAAILTLPPSEELSGFQVYSFSLKLRFSPAKSSPLVPCPQGSPFLGEPEPPLSISTD